VTRVAAAFVGCKVSQADSDEALARLCAFGLSPAARDDADVVIVHTCCVTAEAERKSRQVARREARAGRRVVVAGCAAALHPEQFLEPGLELLGGRSWDELAEGCGEARAEATPAPGRRGVAGPRVPGARTRAVVKVQDGCAGSCTYCAVRLARGRPQSRPLAETLAGKVREIEGAEVPVGTVSGKTVVAAFENVSVATIGSTAQPQYDIVATVDALVASTYSKSEAGTA